MGDLQGRRILVVDDKPHVLGLLRKLFANEGAQVYGAIDGQEALRLLPKIRPDLVLLDDALPGMDGWQVGMCIREQSTVPIIFMPAGGPLLDSELEPDAGIGIIDYVPKPFHPELLIYRAIVAIRQAESSRLGEQQGDYRDHRLAIDLSEQRVSVWGELVVLTPTEYRLLAYLVQHAEQVRTFEQILDHVWGPGYEDAKGSVYLCISRLRHKLERDPGEPEHLVSVRRVGYRFQRIPHQSRI
jgi:DNA-binding response OmpR family regulator